MIFTPPLDDGTCYLITIGKQDNQLSLWRYMPGGDLMNIHIEDASLDHGNPLTLEEDINMRLDRELQRDSMRQSFVSGIGSVGGVA